MELKVTKRGNSLGITIPKEMLNQLNVKEGDTLYATKTQDSYEVSVRNPDFAKKLEAARECMRIYRNTLAELAR